MYFDFRYEQKKVLHSAKYDQGTDGEWGGWNGARDRVAKNGMDGADEELYPFAKDLLMFYDTVQSYVTEYIQVCHDSGLWPDGPVAAWLDGSMACA